MLAQPGLEAPGSSVVTSTELDEELQRILAALYQGVDEADDFVTVAMDLSFLESMEAGIKEMQGRHNQKWQVLKKQRESANKVDQQLRDKGNELCGWHDKQFQVLTRQHETISMAREDVTAREARLAERKALLDAKGQNISSREEKLGATLRAKDDDLEALVNNAPKS